MSTLCATFRKLPRFRHKMFALFESWLKNIIQNGSHHRDGEVSRRIMFSNVIFLALPVVYLVFILMDIGTYFSPFYKLAFDQFIVPIVIAVCLVNLWLNKKGFTKATRLIFLLAWPVLMHTVPIILMNTPIDYYLAYPIGIIFHSILVQLMFSYKKETVYFISLMLLNIGAILTFPQFLGEFQIIGLPELVEDQFYFLVGILYWLLFNLVTFYVLNVMDTYILDQSKKKQLIEQQKEELNLLNQNLESLVALRTKELEEMNEKLRQYAFYNAHHLRGSFCKIQGFFDVYEIENQAFSEKREVRQKLIDSIQELDERILEIQKITTTRME